MDSEASKKFGLGRAVEMALNAAAREAWIAAEATGRLGAEGLKGALDDVEFEVTEEAVAVAVAALLAASWQNNWNVGALVVRELEKQKEESRG